MHFVFLVHGMGQPEPDWSKEAQRQIVKWYDRLGLGDLSERYRFVPVHYNKIFERMRVAHDNLGDALDGLDEDAVASAAAGSQTYTLIQKYGAADGLFYTHALDVLQYRFSREVREQVHVPVRKQILDVLEKEPGRPRFSIIAHSLGTAVIHNAMQEWYNEDARRLSSLPIHTLAMVANVSRVLQLPIMKVFESNIRPGMQKNGAVRRYLNVCNTYDPFCHVKPFLPNKNPHPDNWAQNFNFQNGAFVARKPEHIASLKAVHSLEGYFENPIVCEGLFRCLEVDAKIVKPGALEKFHQEYLLETPPGQLQLIRQRLERAQADRDIWGFIRILKDFGDIL